MKNYTDNELLRELESRGWYKSEKPFVIGCCGKGRKVTVNKTVELIRNPWEPNKETEDNIQLTAEALEYFLDAYHFNGRLTTKQTTNGELLTAVINYD